MISNSSLITIYIYQNFNIFCYLVSRAWFVCLGYVMNYIVSFIFILFFVCGLMWLDLQGIVHYQCIIKIFQWLKKIKNKNKELPFFSWKIYIKKVRDSNHSFSCIESTFGFSILKWVVHQIFWYLNWILINHLYINWSTVFFFI